MSEIERAAEVLSEALDMDDHPDHHRSMPGAEALAGARLLVTDEIRLVLAIAAVLTQRAQRPDWNQSVLLVELGGAVDAWLATWGSAT
jgi:hypothetical protein